MALLGCEGELANGISQAASDGKLPAGLSAANLNNTALSNDALSMIDNALSLSGRTYETVALFVNEYDFEVRNELMFTSDTSVTYSTLGSDILQIGRYTIEDDVLHIEPANPSGSKITGILIDDATLIEIPSLGGVYRLKP